MSDAKINKLVIQELIGGGVVLVVDDNKDQADSLARLLKIYGFNAEAYYDLRHARERIGTLEKEGREVAAVVTDDGLAGEQGRNFLVEAQKGNVTGLRSDTPVLVLSGSGDLSGTNILTKGSEDDIDTLVRRLHSFITRRRQMGKSHNDSCDDAIPSQDIPNHVRGLRAKLKMEEEMAAHPRDWRSENMMAYEEPDAVHVRALRERSQHQEAAQRLRKEILTWEEKVQKMEGGQSLPPHS